MSSEKIFLYTTGGRTLWVPGHTPSPDENKPVHILQIASPRELTRSFYLFDFPVQLFENPRDAAMTPGGKTPEEVINAVNEFRRICSEDQQFLMQRCYDPHKPLPTAPHASSASLPQGPPPMPQVPLAMPLAMSPQPQQQQQQPPQQPAPPFHQHHQLHPHQHHQLHQHHQHQHLKHHQHQHQHRAEHRQDRQQVPLHQTRPPAFHPFSPAATNNQAMLSYLMEQYRQPNMKQVASPLQQPPPPMQGNLPLLRTPLGVPVGNPRNSQMKRGGHGMSSPVEGTRVEEPEPLPSTISNIPQDVLDAYMNPGQLLVLAVLPVLHITVWLRANKLPQDKAEGRVLNCKGFKVFLRASSEDVADFKPVEVLGYQICMYYLLHNYCARHDCLHHHHTVKQLRYLLAAKHVELEGMSTKERKELSTQIATREKSRLEALKKERELKRLVKDMSRGHAKQQPDATAPGPAAESGSRKQAPRKNEENKKLINIGLTDSGDDDDDKDGSSSEYSSHHSVVSAENEGNHITESSKTGLGERPLPALPKLVMTLSNSVDAPSTQPLVAAEHQRVGEKIRPKATDFASETTLLEDIKGEALQPDDDNNAYEHNENSNSNTNNNGDDDDDDDDDDDVEDDAEDGQSGDDKAGNWDQNIKSKPKPKGKGRKVGVKRVRSPAPKKNAKVGKPKK